jgi:hypothetical protein
MRADGSRDCHTSNGCDDETMCEAFKPRGCNVHPWPISAVRRSAVPHHGTDVVRHARRILRDIQIVVISIECISTCGVIRFYCMYHRMDSLCTYVLDSPNANHIREVMAPRVSRSRYRAKTPDEIHSPLHHPRLTAQHLPLILFLKPSSTSR